MRPNMRDDDLDVKEIELDGYTLRCSVAGWRVINERDYPIGRCYISPDGDDCNSVHYFPTVEDAKVAVVKHLLLQR